MSEYPLRKLSHKLTHMMLENSTWVKYGRNNNTHLKVKALWLQEADYLPMAINLVNIERKVDIVQQMETMACESKSSNFLGPQK